MTTDCSPIKPSLRPIAEYVPKLFTAEDLAEIPGDVPSGTVRFELDDGVLMPLPPLDFAHGATLGQMHALLAGQIADQGTFCGRVGIVLRRNPDRVVGADAAYISNARLPLQVSPKGYLETIPELVVEVLSKNDTKIYIARKVSDYLQAGVQKTWVVDPEMKNVAEYAASAEPQVFDATATITLPEIIPGFALPVAELFR